MTRKVLALALATTIGAAGAASADSYFGVIPQQSGGLLELGTVVSDADGVVEIYDYEGTSRGPLLGTSNVRAGANTDVKVDVKLRPIGDVVAVIRDGDDVLAEKRVRMSRD